MRKTTKSIKETHKLAKKLAKDILNTKSDKATVVALVGELGSGKTTFTQGFAKALGIKEQITSPTFVILKRFKNLIHIDAHRIDNHKEILDLGWGKMLENSKNTILIEWAEKIKKILPKPYYLIKFKHKNESERTIDTSVIK